MTKQSLSLHKCSQQVSVTCPNFTYKTRFDLNKTYKTHVPKIKEKPTGLCENDNRLLEGLVWGHTVGGKN